MLKHLLYHITPVPTHPSVWEWNIQQLQKRLHHFNGRLIAAIAQGPGLVPIAAVVKLLPCFEIIPVANDKELREVASFRELLSRVETLNPAEITFYAHTKGVTRPNDAAVRLWTELLYHHNLDRIADVESLIRRYPVVGALKRYGVFNNFRTAPFWHYAGTFFWFRNSELFWRDWQKVEQYKYGAEEYLSAHFPSYEAACLFGNGVENPYDLNCLKALT